MELFLQVGAKDVLQGRSVLPIVVLKNILQTSSDHLNWHLRKTHAEI